MTTHHITSRKEDTIQALVDAGKYNRANDKISGFPFEKPADSFGIELVGFDKYISSEDAIKELDAKGLRPATATELLLLGAQYPDLQRENPLVALGTVARVSGYRDVACLDGGDAERYLGLHWFGGRWRGLCRFLAVRKSPLENKTLGTSDLDPLVASENIKKGQEVIVEDGKVSVKKEPKKCKTCKRPL